MKTKDFYDVLEPYQSVPCTFIRDDMEEVEGRIYAVAGKFKLPLGQRIEIESEQVVRWLRDAYDVVKYGESYDFIFHGHDSINEFVGVVESI